MCSSGEFGGEQHVKVFGRTNLIQVKDKRVMVSFSLISSCLTFE